MPVLDVIQSMKPVGLKETVERAALLDRIDTKFLVSEQELLNVLETWKETYQVLEIDGTRQFTYANTYLDTPEFELLRWHLQGRRNRAKCRVRTYVESNEHMLEVKVKGLRGQTVKYRRSTGQDPTAKECSEYLVSSLVDAYENAAVSEVEPALGAHYRRITLIAPDFCERITLDHSLSFERFDTGDTYELPKNVWIVEKKSGTGNQADTCPLKMQGLRPMSVSKYVLGMSRLRPEINTNSYRPIHRKLDNMARVAAATA